MIQLADIGKITDVEKLRELYRQADFARFKEDKEVEKLEQGNALFFVPRKPNPRQRVILEAFLNPHYKVLTYTGGNRCIHGDTLIYDPIKGKSTPVRDIRGEHYVLAWDGENIVPAIANEPFTKGSALQYRVKLSSGDSFVAAASHRVLTPSGWIAIARLRPGDLLSTPLSTSLVSPLSAYVGDLRSYQKAANFLYDCFVYCRQCGAPPHLALDTGQGVFPLLADAPTHNSPLGFLLPGGLGNKSKYNHPIGSFFHRAKKDSPPRLAHQAWAWLSRVFHTICAPTALNNQFCEPPKPSTACHTQSTASCRQLANHDIFDSCSTSSDSVVLSISPCCHAVKWDFEVPNYHNYWACGAIHHNSGKTTTGVWLALSVVFGEYVWNPGAVLGFPHKRPRKVRIVGQDWEKHIKTVIEPKLDEWWPKSRPVEKKKNNVGVYAFWKDQITGSTLEIMSNRQESELFEGWDGDFVYYDEPCKREIRVACARGLVDRQGREYFGMTLLGEAWISREIIKARTEAGEPDDTVLNVNATIYDNLGYGVTQEGIDQFAKSLTDNEKEARLLGKPAYLSGLVWPQFSRDLHVKKRFAVPLDWLVDIQIDFHPAKPWAVSFMATDPLGFKYIVDEIWEKGNPKYIAEQIVRKIRANNYRVESAIEIDPLAKGDSNNDFTVYDKIYQALASYGYMLGTGSKDKDNGIIMVRDLLLSENGMPGLYVFSDCVKTVAQIEDYMFDPETGKPEKKNDDFCEVLYRNVLRNTSWYERSDPEADRYRDKPKSNSIAGY